MIVCVLEQEEKRRRGEKRTCDGEARSDECTLWSREEEENRGEEEKRGEHVTERRGLTSVHCGLEKRRRRGEEERTGGEEERTGGEEEKRGEENM